MGKLNVVCAFNVKEDEGDDDEEEEDMMECDIDDEPPRLRDIDSASSREMFL